MIAAYRLVVIVICAAHCMVRAVRSGLFADLEDGQQVDANHVQIVRRYRPARPASCCSGRRAAHHTFHPCLREQVIGVGAMEGLDDPSPLRAAVHAQVGAVQCAHDRACGSHLEGRHQRQALVLGRQLYAQSKLREHGDGMLVIKPEHVRFPTGFWGYKRAPNTPCHAALSA